MSESSSPRCRTGVEVAHSMADQQAVVAVWYQIEHLLLGHGCEGFVRGLALMLPDPAQLSTCELPQLAKLHLSSAHNLMATLKLLAPTAFAGGATHPDLSAFDGLDSSLLSMAATLIELQLFHLTRAAALTAHTRQRLAGQAATRHFQDLSASDTSSSGSLTD